MKNNIKVHICDDHKMMIEGLHLLISSLEGIEVIGHSYNGYELLEWLKNNTVDIILLDINMPEMDGLTACKKLLRDHQGIKVIFLSMINQTSIVHSLFKSGAKGYLLKNSGAQELSEAINKVYKGGVFFDENVLQAENEHPKTFTKGIIPKLTKREKEVLKLIVEEYTSLEIANLLSIGLGTVETHRRNLISKLAVKNTAGLVRVTMEYKLI